MHPGDLVFFWMAGDEHFRGLYGWGRIASEPYLKAGWESHGVDVTYEIKFTKPVMATSLRSDAQLAEMLIFRAAQATNFLLSPEQAKRLVRFVKKSGEETPPLTEGMP
jgi:predicted RNA-binding protein with PUA-like domain